MTASPLLTVDRLSVSFLGGGGEVRAVRDASFIVNPGEIAGIVGESGSGKSATALAILGLLPRRVGRITGGTVAFEDRTISGLPDNDMAAIRGGRIGYVPQEPMSALNPTMTIGRHLLLVQTKKGIPPQTAKANAESGLAAMGFADPRRVLRSYPFELSGGQRQRALIAGAFLLNPALLIADEPTTALDVTIQAEILNLLIGRARAERRSILLITHNLGLVWKHCDSVVVMRRGEVVETGPAANTLAAPKHAYTKALVGALPGSVAPRTFLLTTGEAAT